MSSIHGMLESNLHIYRKIIVQEFIREFHFLADVAAGRAQAKGDFTDKIFQVISAGASGAASYIPEPVSSSIVSNLVQLVLQAANDKRKESKSAVISAIGDELVQDQLRILLEKVSLEIARRYEFSIAAKLSDDPVEGVIPFAKAGVERMLEYLARSNSKLTEEKLLQGLVEGRSGAYISGFTNTRLKPKDGKEKLTAEGIYARSAFRTPNGRYWDLPKECAKHKALSTKEKIKGLGKSLFSYGYVKYDKEGNPKYGFADMPQSMIDRYGYRETVPSIRIQELLAQYPSRVLLVHRQEMEAYSSELTRTPGLSLIQYLQEKNKAPHLRVVLCRGDLTGVPLANADLSSCDLSDCTFSGSLKKTNFQHAYLYYANFSQVTDASGAQFNGAHMEYVSAEGANFNGADFSQADFSFAKLNKAQLNHIKQTGTIWLYAELKEIKTENMSALLEVQEHQHRALKAEIESQQTQLTTLNETLIQQEAELKKLATQLEQFIDAAHPTHAKKDKEQAKQIQDILEQLAIERQSHQVFERFCRTEISTLRQAMQEATETSTTTKQIQQLQQHQLVHQAELDNMYQALQGFDFEQQLRQIEVLEHQIKALDERQSEFDSVKNQLSDLMTAFTQQKLVQADFQQQLQKAQYQMDLLAKTQHDDRQHLQDRLDQFSTSVNKQLNQIRIHQQKFEARLQNLEEQQGQFENHLDSQRRKMGQMKADVGEMQEQQHGMLGNIDHLTAQMQRLTAAIDFIDILKANNQPQVNEINFTELNKYLQQFAQMLNNPHPESTSTPPPSTLNDLLQQAIQPLVKAGFIPQSPLTTHHTPDNKSKSPHSEDLPQKKSDKHKLEEEEVLGILTMQIQAATQQVRVFEKKSVKSKIDPRHLIHLYQLKFLSKLAKGSFGDIYLGR